MRSRTLLIGIAVFVVLGILAGAIFYQVQQRKPEPSPEASPISMESPLPDGSPAPEVSGVPTTNQNPDLSVDENGLSKATVVINTNKGIIKYKLYPKDAPNTVNRIVELINKGFYNGLVFHRVVPGFVVQGGDPQGNGTGGSGQRIRAEFNSRRHVEGTVAMARATDPDSADSQFYITLSPQPQLDRSYTVFGQVIEGMDVVRNLQLGDKMVSVTIE